jgi:hypothetical protein
VKFGVTRPGGEEIVLASGTTNVQMTLSESGLAYGKHQYWIKMWILRENNQLEWMTTQSVDAVIDGRTVRGTLPFDENIASDAVIGGSLTVPASRTLTLNAVKLSGGNLIVYGHLAMQPGLQLDGPVELHSPHQLAGFRGGNWSFPIGSRGSSISGSSNFVAYFEHTDFTVQDCRDYRLDVRSPSMRLSGLVDGKLILHGRAAALSSLSNMVLNVWNVTGSLEVSKSQVTGIEGDRVPVSSFQEVDFACDGITFRGASEATKCIFRGSLEVANGAPFEATDCKFDSLSLIQAPAEKTTVWSSQFAGAVQVYGGSPVFRRCEFGVEVNLINRSGTRIDSCHFLGPLRFANDDNPAFAPRWHQSRGGATTWIEPLIQYNSFLGPTAIEYYRLDPWVQGH